MFSSKFFLPLFLLVGIFYSLSVKAEYCDMVGCEGQRWIYIPKSQYENNNKTEHIVNDVKYTFDRTERLFEEDELPQIGQIVTLNVNVRSFTQMPRSSTSDPEPEPKHWLKIQEVEKEPLIYYPKSKIIFINDQAYQNPYPGMPRRGSWDLNKGMKLKILDFKHIENVLFAWVEIVN